MTFSTVQSQMLIIVITTDKHTTYVNRMTAIKVKQDLQATKTGF